MPARALHPRGRQHARYRPVARLGSVFHVPLDSRPSEAAFDVVAQVAELVGVRLTDLEPVLYNNVPEWQVGPAEPPISRQEGLRRLEAASE